MSNLIGYEIELRGFDEQLKKLKDYDRVSDKYITEAMNKSGLLLVSKIKPLTPVYRGALRNSIGSEVIHESATSIVGRVGSSLKSEQYPAVMEFGRRPGAKMPPPDALERWVHLKLGTVEGSGVGFVIARSIARKGIKGKRFMKRGWEAGKAQVNKFFEEALEKIADALAVK